MSKYISILAALLLVALSGQKDKARNVMASIVQSPHSKDAAHSLAIIATALGDKDTAFRWLQVARDDRSGSLILMKITPYWDRSALTLVSLACFTMSDWIPQPIRISYWIHCGSKYSSTSRWRILIISEAFESSRDFSSKPPTRP